MARDAFPRECDRADGAVGCRGELGRPCRFPIKQMPAGNSSNPSSQAPSLPLSLSLRSTAEGGSAERTCRAACEIRIEAGLLLMCVAYVRPTFRLSMCARVIYICIAYICVARARIAATIFRHTRTIARVRLKFLINRFVWVKSFAFTDASFCILPEVCNKIGQLAKFLIYGKK